MREHYIPPSDFLQAVIAEDIPFGERNVGEINLKRLIMATRDPVTANRDWATLLLSQLKMDRSDVRDALTVAASDENANVRAEAILGLTQIDRSLALQFLQKELSGDRISMPLLEAASIVADRSLIHDLEAFAQPSENALLDTLVMDAIRACRNAQKNLTP